MAAALELSASPSVPPAPAAGMYWSRSVTYGRGPSRPLRAHTINLIGEQLFVFGGCDIKTCFNSLYVLDMDTMTWSKPRTLGQPPPPCRAHSSTLVERDLGSGKRAHYLYIFGGGDGPNYFNDLYVLNADTLVWSKPATEGIPPSPRRAHTTCLWNDKIVVMGGGDGARALSDVHILDISDPSRPRWSQLSTSGVPPIARGYHTSNLVKDKLIVFGGSDGHECFSDVHVLDLVTNRWTQVELDRIVPRLAHSATQVGSYVFVIGGHDGSRYSNDVLLLNLVTMSWESRRIYGGAPSPRGYHAAVLHDSRLYVLGGYDGKTVFDDVYMLELSACAYLPQITNFEIDL
ncbi:galactose oxidase [Lichtheimia hyalospora FSU 10163]|nr:galactose oxidase [Lichtheimia hyalospora FSU 10163]